MHDGGNGGCVPVGNCSPGFTLNGVTGQCRANVVCAGDEHDDGTGVCVPDARGCANGMHDGGDSRCVAMGTCSAGYKLDNRGRCVATIVCAEGWHPDGATPPTCVPDRACGEGMQDNGVGVCVVIAVPPDCAVGFHDGGAGACVPAGFCQQGFRMEGSACVAELVCLEGEHDGGIGVCVEIGTCSPGYHDGGGMCVPDLACPAGEHNDGQGQCVPATKCAAGMHDGGNGACVPVGTCTPSYRLDGVSGVCLPAVVCPHGQHDDGTGRCVPQSTGCATGMRDGGDGACVPESQCSAGYRLDAGGACVPEFRCQTGYHSDGGVPPACVPDMGCAAGFRDDGTGRCVAVTAPCAAGFHDGGTGVCVPEGTCQLGYRLDSGACVPALDCPAGMHDGGDGTCVALGVCKTGYHDGGGGVCVPDVVCPQGQQNDGAGLCVPAGQCAEGRHDDHGLCCQDGAYNSNTICCAEGTWNDGRGRCIGNPKGCEAGLIFDKGLCCAEGEYNSDHFCCPVGKWNDGAGNCTDDRTACAAGHRLDQGLCCPTSESASNWICCLDGTWNDGHGLCVDDRAACVTGTRYNGGLCCAAGEHGSSRICCPDGSESDGQGHCTNPWTNRVVHGGGCGTAAGSSASGGFTLLALAALLLSAFGARRRALPLIAALAAMAPAGGARAEEAPRFQVQRFEPLGGAHDILAVPSAKTAKHLQWGFSGLFNLSSGPLSLGDPDGKLSDLAVIERQTMGELGMTLGLFDRLELSVTLPVQLSMASTAVAESFDNDNAIVPSFALADVRVAPKVSFELPGEFLLGVVVPVTVPTGEATFVNNQGLTASPMLLLEWAGPVRAVGGLGYRYRQTVDVGPVKVAHALTYALAAERPFALYGQDFDAQATFVGEAGLEESRTESRPMELLGALRWRPGAGFAVTAGGGAGLGRGYGTADWRVLGGIAYVSPIPERPREPLSTKPESIEATAGSKVALRPLERVSGAPRETLKLVKVENPTHGKVTVYADNTVEYLAPEDHQGHDAFAYEVEDGTGRKVTGSVSVKVNPKPVVKLDPLIAESDTATVEGGKKVAIDILANDRGAPRADMRVTIATAPKKGKVVIHSDGVAEYEANLKEEGHDAFEYKLTDAAGRSVAGKVSVAVTKAQPVRAILRDNKIEILEAVNFIVDKAVIKESSAPLLNQVANILRENPRIKKVQIQGHTDTSGKPAKNRTLSQARADAIRAYLVEVGVERDRLETMGFGPDKPLVPNTTKANRAKNRRVEFVILQQ